MRRRNVPCSPCSGGSSGSCDCCGIKEKLRILWDRTIGSILRINGISPDGNGDFTIEAGDNIALSERGTGNGIRIDTTGAVSYYSSGDSYVNVDNNDLEISVNVGTGGLATDNDLQTVAGAVSDILDGTTTVPKATDAQYLGSSSSNVGDDTNPIKIVNGQAVAVANAFAPNSAVTPVFGTATRGSGFSSGTIEYAKIGKIVIVSLVGLVPIATGVNQAVATGLPKCSASLSSHTHAWNDNVEIGNLWIDKNSTTMYQSVLNTTIYWQTLVYLTD